MSNPAITLVPPRRYYDTATIAETHRRLQADGHNISENMLRGLVRQGEAGPQGITLLPERHQTADRGQQ